MKRYQQRWGELDANAQARLQKLADLPRLAELLAELVATSIAEEWKTSI